MALFAHRPQEKLEWAGIPGEPLRPESPAERLPDAAPALDDLGFAAGGVASISIPIEPAVRDAQEAQCGQESADATEG
ncbi:MAG: hypothetical protein ACK5IN_06020 [Microbacterium sp.]|uniref:hypothetical protein n=1 Tax=Microbacterium sp. TaxID=51671 RepID=UPI003A8C49A7